MTVNLNVGCGDTRATGPWLNVDLHADGPRPDVCASVLELPFPDRAFPRVYAGHLLEHTCRLDTARALRELVRVCAGQLLIVGPDPHAYGQPADTTSSAALPSAVVPLPPQVRDGGCRWPGDEHRWLPTADWIAEWSVDAGAVIAKVLSPDDLYWLSAALWPIEDTGPGQYVVLVEV